MFPSVEFFFQPADIVSQILNFGLPSPIDIQVIGKSQVQNYEIAQSLANQMRHVPGAADVHVQQLMNSPALQLNVDRTRAQQVGLQQRDVAQNLLVSLSGSFQTAPTFWLNKQNGVTYNVAVQTPEYRVDSLQALMNTPVNAPGAPAPQVLANLATVKPAVTPALVSHYDIQPVMDVYASIQGRDLGGVARDTRKIIAAAQKNLPRGTEIVMRGQVETMTSSFVGLGVGLVMSIVLVYLLIVVNFQSWLDPFIIITALPGALAGICLDAAAHAHHVECAIADRRGDVHGRSNGEQYSGDFFRPREDGRRHELSGSRNGSRLYTHAPGDYDGAGDDDRHGADGDGIW